MPKFYKDFSDFSDSLDKELSWRKHELHLLKNVIPDKICKKQQAFLRMSIPILYAHWEGFVNNASTNYLKYIKSKRLKYNELRVQFIALGLRSELDLLEAKDLEKQTQIVQFVLEKYNDRANVPYKKIINTKANLKYRVFLNILFLIGIDESHFKSFQSIIDDLVDLRNFIAHGENNIIDFETFINFFSEMISVMELFKIKIENSAINEEFRKIGTEYSLVLNYHKR